METEKVGTDDDGDEEDVTTAEIADLKFEVFALCIFAPRYFSLKVETDVGEDVEEDDESDEG